MMNFMSKIEIEAELSFELNAIVAAKLKKGMKIKDIVDELGKNDGDKITNVLAKITLINSCKTLKLLITTEEQRKEFAEVIIATGEELKTIKGEIKDE